MTKKWILYRVEETEICIPSDDYYKRQGDFYTQLNTVLFEKGNFNSEEEALENIKNTPDFGYRYVILPIYE